ncbi:hypothetical protein CkaCkLH20_03688 [Colletotrichum karsti]|uniref:Ankyrin repeat protein n=1 Tax=Colletotrichum karsti TaxID=1095194 RepID=A0A9P6LMG0_9PEZI|nr:uncharacterized protein CkaCkLH20_03688 [Colletotrichum karsti]KAF9878788.1 hypothetical protein CkaCkLH20_03688 [Colletotrichum karsti]
MSGKHLATMTGASEGVKRSAIGSLPVDLLLIIMDELLDSYKEDIELGYFAPEIAEGRQDECTFARFDVWKGLVRLASTCRALYNAITPAIYRKDVKLNHASALLLSVKNGNISAVVKSLDQGANVNQNDYTEVVRYQGECPLHDHESARWRMKYCVWTVREMVRLNISPLVWAVFYRDTETTKLLLERGADVNGFLDLPRDKMYHLGAFMPCGDRRFLCPSVRSLFRQLDSKLGDAPGGLEIPPNITRCLDPSLRTGGNALYCALLNRSRADGHYFDRGKREPWAPIAKLLVEAGADLVTLKSIGLHALHQICGNLNLDMAGYILKRGVDPNVRDHLGNTALHYVALNYRHGYHDRRGDCPSLLVRLLQDYGADVNAVNKGGYTPLHYCFMFELHDNFEAALALCKAGARIPSGFVGRLYRIRIEVSSFYFRDLIDQTIVLANQAEEFTGRTVIASPDGVNEDLTRAHHVLFYWLWRRILATTYIATGDDEDDVETWTPYDWAVYWHAQHRLVYGT